MERVSLKRLLALMLILVPMEQLFAQPEAFHVSGRIQPVEFTLFPLYQSYTDDGQRISEVSFPFWMILPLERNTTFSLAGSSASVTGDDLTDVSSFGDLQVALSHLLRTGSSTTVLSLGANIPSGNRNLAPEEFNTSVLLSQSYYDFRSPVLAQGFNVAPGVTWAYPLTESLVIGLTASYQYRGEFTPIEGGGQYNPGDEVLVVGGIDVQVNPQWSISGDAAFTAYQADKLDGVETFTSGNRVSLTLQLLNQSGFNTLHLLARYQNKTESELPTGFGPEDALLRTVPNLAEIRGSYRGRFGQTVYVTFFARGRAFGETDACTVSLAACDSKAFVDLGISPDLQLTDQLNLIVRGAFRTGDITGFELGAGLGVKL